MRLLSVNAGGPREMRWRGRTLRSAIWKDAIPGRVRVERLNVAGDAQAELDLHGGVEKAVYVYPFEHYAYWLPVLGDLRFGAFGENLTTEGLRERDVRVGDRLAVGSTLLEVTQPRTPCVKLAARFKRPALVREFLQSGRTGFYCSVVRAGEVGAGDAIERIEPGRGPTIAELVARVTP